MPLRNRVTPFGDIVAIPERGMFIGNRGIIHDPATRTIRRGWAHKNWLVCVCEFKGRHRTIMAPNRWTELFFMDEATAFAAGHRPCFECRRADAKAFQAAWAHGRELPRAKAMDAVLHGERLSGRAKRLHPVADLPDGAMVAVGQDAFLVIAGGARRWSPAGYGAIEPMPASAMLLTPPSTVRALAAGYRPRLHPSVCTGT